MAMHKFVSPFWWTFLGTFLDKVQKGSEYRINRKFVPQPVFQVLTEMEYQCGEN